MPMPITLNILFPWMSGSTTTFMVKELSMENQKYYTKLKQIMENPERKNKLFEAVFSSSGKEVSVAQRSEEWLTWRREGITATEAVVIAKGEHFGKNISTLFDEKAGNIKTKNFSNQYIQRGVVFEESVLQFVSTHRQVSVKKAACYQNQVLPLLRCSLDGECIVDGKNFDLEVKCLSEKVFNELQKHGINSDTYRKYWIQIQYQLLVTGYKNALLCCALVDDTRMYRYQEFLIERDEEFLKKLLEKVIIFWLKVASYIPEGDLKETKKVPFISENSLPELITQRTELEEKIKEIQKQIDEKFSIIQKEMNENHLSKIDLGFGIYTKTEAKGNFDYKAFLAAKGVMITPEDEDSYRKKSSIRWSFKPVAA